MVERLLEVQQENLDESARYREEMEVWMDKLKENMGTYDAFVARNPMPKDVPLFIFHLFVSVRHENLEDGYWDGNSEVMPRQKVTYFWDYEKIGMAQDAMREYLLGKGVELPQGEVNDE